MVHPRGAELAIGRLYKEFFAVRNKSYNGIAIARKALRHGRQFLGFRELCLPLVCPNPGFGFHFLYFALHERERTTTAVHTETETSEQTNDRDGSWCARWYDLSSGACPRSCAMMAEREAWSVGSFA